MKKVVEVGIGGQAFTIDEDAHLRLEGYLKQFGAKVPFDQRSEVMADIEARIAELLKSEMHMEGQVASIDLVEKIIGQLGMPDGSVYAESDDNSNKDTNKSTIMEGRKLYRNVEDKKIAGVCSGLSAFFNMDVTLVRIIMLICLICGSAGFWIYLVIWIVAPIAKTPAQKCEMYGIPVTAENMAKFQ